MKTSWIMKVLGRRNRKVCLSSVEEPHIAHLIRLKICLVCCIYHKPKRFDESSGEDSSDSDSDSNCGRESHPHIGHHSGDNGTERHCDSGGIPEDSEPNAYEVGPGKKDKGRAT